LVQSFWRLLKETAEGWNRIDAPRLGAALAYYIMLSTAPLVPDVHVEWRDVRSGAAITALLFSLGKFAIGLYLGKAGIGSAYGAAGSLMAYTVWVYYSAQIFFFEAQFTRTFAEPHGLGAHLRLTEAVPPPAAETPEIRNSRLA
jgi:membrane protein